MFVKSEERFHHVCWPTDLHPRVDGICVFSTRMAKEKWLRGGVVDASYMENLYTPVAKCKNPGYSRISIYSDSDPDGSAFEMHLGWAQPTPLLALSDTRLIYIEPKHQNLTQTLDPVAAQLTMRRYFLPEAKNCTMFAQYVVTKTRFFLDLFERETHERVPLTQSVDKDWTKLKPNVLNPPKKRKPPRLKPGLRTFNFIHVVKLQKMQSTPPAEKKVMLMRSCNSI